MEYFRVLFWPELNYKPQEGRCLPDRVDKSDAGVWTMKELIHSYGPDLDYMPILREGDTIPDMTNALGIIIEFSHYEEYFSREDMAHIDWSGVPDSERFS